MNINIWDILIFNVCPGVGIIIAPRGIVFVHVMYITLFLDYVITLAIIRSTFIYSIIIWLCKKCLGYVVGTV